MTRRLELTESDDILCRAQFARRDYVYYHSIPVKEADAFLIICTITSSPQPPIQPPTAPAQLVPKDFLERVGTLLDDPLYSDVEFVLPRRSRPGEKRTIYANRKILERADYFQTSTIPALPTVQGTYSKNNS
jgi:hypothetical protein